MMRLLKRLSAVTLAVFCVAAGCIEINLPEEGLLGGGPFVLKGEAEGVEEDGACLIWLAIDGRRFVLFQVARVSNEDFDSVTTPGTQSRLELSPRSALRGECRRDATAAEVTQILEIDGVSQQSTFPFGQKIDATDPQIDQLVYEHG